jgi:hypothetical protein
VDGFDQDESGGEGDEGGKVSLCLFASEGDALEALELTDGLLDARPASVESRGEEVGFVLFVGLGRDDGNDPALARRLTVCLAGIALVADRGARVDVRTKIEQDLEVRRIALLAAGQIEGDGMAVEIGLQVDLGREAAARAAEGLTVLPPFAPAAETWARTTVESNICTKWAEEDSEARWSKKASNTPALLSRSKRFQTLFHLPKRSGSARQLML